MVLSRENERSIISEAKTFTPTSCPYSVSVSRMFTSFSARMDLVPVPYLLKVKQESRIYDELVATIGTRKHVAPHVQRLAAIWAVLCRLHRPNPENYPSDVRSIIRELKRGLPETESIVLDTPPGTACPVISTLHGVDAVLLVTEPTPFGLHDLRAAVNVARSLELPAGVVINRDGIGDEDVERYCEEEGLPILLRIPFDRRIAETGAEARLLIDALPEWKQPFTQLAVDVKGLTA